VHRVLVVVYVQLYKYIRSMFLKQQWRLNIIPHRIPTHLGNMCLQQRCPSPKWA